MELQRIQDKEIINNGVSMTDLFDEIRNLKMQLEHLERKIDNGNNILNNHINFINNVFDTIKKPLYYILNKVNTVLLE